MSRCDVIKCMFKQIFFLNYFLFLDTFFLLAHINTLPWLLYSVADMQFSTKHKKSIKYTYEHTHVLSRHRQCFVGWKRWMNVCCFHTYSMLFRNFLRVVWIGIRIMRKGKIQLIKSENHVSYIFFYGKWTEFGYTRKTIVLKGETK